MKRNTSVFFMLLFVFLLTSSLSAQNGWEVVIDQYNFEQDILMAYAGDKNVDAPGQIKKLFTRIELSELLAYAKKNNYSYQLDKTTFRTVGNMARMDMNSEDQNISIVFNRKTGDVTFARHDRKQKATTNKKKMENMRKNMMGDVKSPTDMGINMEEIIKSLPPDKQKEAMEALEKAKKSGYTGSMPGKMGSKKMDRKITETGNKGKANGFPYVEYLVTVGDKTIVLKNTKSLPKLTKLYHEISDDFEKIFGMGSEKDPDDLSDEFPNSIPVVKTTFEFNIYGNTQLDFENMVSAKHTNLNKNIFTEFGNYNEVPFMNIMMP